MRRNKNLKNLTVTFIAGLIVGAGLLYAGLNLGWIQTSQRVIFLPANATSTILNADMELFWNSLSLIKEKHFRIDEVSDQDLLYGAINGLLGALGDPYSSFFNPSDAKKFEEDIEGSFGGIGAEIGIRNNQLLIVAPLKGNPAEAAGLKAGDQILKVDDTLTNNLTVEEAVKIIRGEVGTEVTLLILRDLWGEAREFKITRGLVVVPTLDWEMRDGGIVHFQLYNFNANAPQLFYGASLSALTQGARGAILDLRNNSGGFLEVAVNISGWFLDRGDVIVRERFRSGEEDVLRASGPAAFAGVPTVVLVNGGSASASEIVAGALRDNRGIKLIGEKTFGKGTVQEVENLAGGSSLKISVAEWLTPKGTVIEGNGLEPDFDVKLTESDSASDRDPQLEKALEVLEEEIAKSGRTIFILGS
ncbi:MAG: S41 family peptidase [Candidatus Brennerbacteria bacterium]|nr:S41 family peptidase [Candidatus Brennerbacteria bacterium]